MSATSKVTEREVDEARFQIDNLASVLGWEAVTAAAAEFISEDTGDGLSQMDSI